MNDKYYMELALKQAEKAALENEVPIGAVIVHEDKVIASTYNQRKSTEKATAHAEILAIEEANKILGSWRLDTCTLYVTIEPCPMCAGAIIQSRMKRIVYGSKEPKFGAHTSQVNLFEVPFNHSVEVKAGILEEECSIIMKKFFQNLRKK